MYMASASNPVSSTEIECSSEHKIDILHRKDTEEPECCIYKVPENLRKKKSGSLYSSIDLNWPYSPRPGETEANG